MYNAKISHNISTLHTVIAITYQIWVKSADKHRRYPFRIISGLESGSGSLGIFEDSTRGPDGSIYGLTVSGWKLKKRSVLWVTSTNSQGWQLTNISVLRSSGEDCHEGCRACRRAAACLLFTVSHTDDAAQRHRHHKITQRAQTPPRPLHFRPGVSRVKKVK